MNQLAYIIVVIHDSPYPRNERVLEEGQQLLSPKIERYLLVVLLHPITQ